jgi:DNA-binding NarL/FixJ family response regulator
MAHDLTNSRGQSARKVFIVEDHPVFRQGLKQMVNGEKDLSVCGESGDAESAFSAIKRLKPDLVLVDITLPGESGLDLIKRVRKAQPSSKLLVVSMHDEALYANRVLRAGASGYIMKQEDPDEIVHAIRDVLGGHIYLSEEVLGKRAATQSGTEAKAPNGALEQFTDEELEVLECLGQGKTQREIARLLKLSPATVTARCARIKKKLKLKSANELIRYAVCWVESGGEA